MPTISELLTRYRDLSGASYEDMSRSVNGAITPAWFHKLTTAPPSSFPRNAATVQHLADLLQVPAATVVLAFATSLGLPISQVGSPLAITMPPGTDILEPRDVEAIRLVIRQLVDARRSGGPPPEPDFSKVEGIRLAEEQTLRAVDTPKE